MGPLRLPRCEPYSGSMTAANSKQYTDIVSTDGSALRNPNGPMGWGWINHATGAHDAGGANNGTNQIGELCAVLEALRHHHDSAHLLIESDSQYAINCSSTWIQGWKRNDWKNSQKKLVKNVALIKAIDWETTNRPGTVSFKWVKGHAGNKFNEIVDKLAHGYSSAVEAGTKPARMPLEGWQALLDSPYRQGLAVPPEVLRQVAALKPNKTTRTTASVRHSYAHQPRSQSSRSSITGSDQRSVRSAATLKGDTVTRRWTQGGIMDDAIRNEVRTAQDVLKKEAGIAAAELVKPGMTVGLGTGSTVRYLVDELGRRHQEEGLDIIGVTTSRRTSRQAQSYGIRIVDIDDVGRLDLTIDGADQVDANFNGIKGGGAALLWEKIVAVNSDHYVWIVDRSKLCDEIGAFPLPVEVVPFGARHVVSHFRERGYEPVLRTGEDGIPIHTDENNYIVDLHLGHIDHPSELAQDLISTVGVVEHGLFLNMVDEVIVGNPGKPTVLVNPFKR